MVENDRGRGVWSGGGRPATIRLPRVLNLVADRHLSGHRDRYDRSMEPLLADLILVIAAGAEPTHRWTTALMGVLPASLLASATMPIRWSGSIARPARQPRLAPSW